MLDQWIINTGRTREELYHTTLGDFVRHLLHAAVKEAKASNDVRLLTSFMVNMVSKKKYGPEDLWKIPVIDRPKTAPDWIDPAQAAMLKQVLLNAAGGIVANGSEASS